MVRSIPHPLGVVEKYDVLAVYIDLSVVLYRGPASKGVYSSLPVVVALDQVFVAIKLIEDLLEFAFATETKVAEVVDSIGHFDPFVPIRDQRLIHLSDGPEWTL